MSADDLVDLHVYRRVMSDLLDKHCPVVQVRRRTKSTARWFDADCLAARWSARAAECSLQVQEDAFRRRQKQLAYN